MSTPPPPPPPPPLPPRSKMGHNATTAVQIQHDIMHAKIDTVLMPKLSLVMVNTIAQMAFISRQVYNGQGRMLSRFVSKLEDVLEHVCTNVNFVDDVVLDVCLHEIEQVCSSQYVQFCTDVQLNAKWEWVAYLAGWSAVRLSQDAQQEQIDAVKRIRHLVEYDMNELCSARGKWLVGYILAFARNVCIRRAHYDQDVVEQQYKEFEQLFCV